MIAIEFCVGSDDYMLLHAATFMNEEELLEWKLEQIRKYGVGYIFIVETYRV
jgi:hypothetical protein